MSTSDLRRFRYAAPRNFRDGRSFSDRSTMTDAPVRDISNGTVMTRTHSTGTSTIGTDVTGKIAGLGREMPACQY